MMKIDKIIFGAVMMVTLAGCMPEPLPVTDIPKLEPRIVVSSQMIPEQGLVVVITRSIGALDAGDNSDVATLLDQIVIDNAIVTINYNGRSDTLSNLGNGVYGGLDVEWEQGISYELQVMTDDMGTVTATTQLAERVPFDDASLTLLPSGSDSVLDVRYSFNDPEGKNYYVVSVQKYSATQDAADLLNPRIFNVLVEDKDFDGQHYADGFKLPFPRFHQGDSVALFLSSVSQDYYKFLKVQKDSEFSLVEFISEPMNYPSNVNGGYGYFNLHLPDVRLFELE